MISKEYSRTVQTMPSYNNNNFSIKRKRGVTNRSDKVLLLVKEEKKKKKKKNYNLAVYIISAYTHFYELKIMLTHRSPSPPPIIDGKSHEEKRKGLSWNI